MIKQIGFLFNADLCLGCKACEIACKNENQTQTNVHWRRVTSVGEGEYLSLSCNHCESPECFRVCPNRAYTKRRDGIVEINTDRCDGCMTCVSACPYKSPQFDVQLNKASKCQLCLPRRLKGLQPACVNACHTGSLRVIDLEEEIPEGAVATLNSFPDIRLTRPSIRFYPAKVRKQYRIKS